MELDKLDVSLVFAAGNDGFHEPINHYPGAFASSETLSRYSGTLPSADLQRLVNNIIIAGASDHNGNAANFNQRVFDDGSSAEKNIVYAPGETVAVPGFSDNDNSLEYASGTSVC